MLMILETILMRVWIFFWVTVSPPWWQEENEEESGSEEGEESEEEEDGESDEEEDEEASSADEADEEEEEDEEDGMEEPEAKPAKQEVLKRPSGASTPAAKLVMGPTSPPRVLGPRSVVLWILWLEILLIQRYI